MPLAIRQILTASSDLSRRVAAKLGQQFASVTGLASGCRGTEAALVNVLILTVLAIASR